MIKSFSDLGGAGFAVIPGDGRGKIVPPRRKKDDQFTFGRNAIKVVANIVGKFLSQVVDDDQSTHPAGNRREFRRGS